MSTIDQQFVEFVVTSLVSKPDVVHVDRRIDEKGVLLELTVDPEDLGRVIGKRGATAQSLRTLLRALGTKNDARYNLKIIDNGVPPEQREYRSSQPAAPPDDSINNETNVVADEPVAENSSEEVMTDIPEQEPYDSGSDRLERTRKELKELDDLDV